MDFTKFATDWKLFEFEGKVVRDREVAGKVHKRFFVTSPRQVHTKSTSCSTQEGDRQSSQKVFRNKFTPSPQVVRKREVTGKVRRVARVQVEGQVLKGYRFTVKKKRFEFKLRKASPSWNKFPVVEGV